MKRTKALALSQLFCALGAAVGCDDDSCSSNEQKVGSVCVRTHIDQPIDSDASAREGGRDRSADAGLGTEVGIDGGDKNRPIALECPVAGHCAEWPMPDSLGKAHPLYKVEQDVVADMVTGLVWQRNATEGNCSEGGPACIYEQAESYCKGLSLGGIDDWRLPSAVELQSIFVLDGSQYVLDPMLFPSTSTRGVLTATKRLEQLGRDVTIYSHGGTALEGARLGSVQARCVSGGIHAQGPRYSVDALGGLVSDNWTNLVWRYREEDGVFDFEGAKRQCANLGDGWRLPTAKEILTLVTPNHLQRCIDERAFHAPFSEELWSSTGYESSSDAQRNELTQLSLGMRVLDDYRCGDIVLHDATMHARLNVRCVR